MSQILIDIINIVEMSFAEPKRTDEEMQNLYRLRKVIPQLDKAEKQSIIEYFLDSILPADRPIALLLFLYDVFADKRFINKTMEYVYLINTPEYFYETYWNISNRLFNAKQEGDANILPMRDIFVSISKNLRDFIFQRGYGSKKKINKITNIAILSPQLINMRHSPTREAYNLACHLNEYHDCNVYVFNTNGMTYTNVLGIERPFYANWSREMKGAQILPIDYLEFKKKPINVQTFEQGAMSTAKIVNIIEKLDELDIHAIIAHGENLLIQDVLYGVYPSLFATTGGVLPFARCDSYWIPGNLLTSENEQLGKQYGHENFMKESMLVSPEGKANQKKDQKIFNIPDNNFIYLVVGVRLTLEIDDDFISLCIRILEQDEQSSIIFAGTAELDLCRFFTQEMIDNHRVINIGFQDDLATICLMSDVYLNPRRNGGGTSSQTAILNKSPVVTLDYGHISAVVPQTHRFKSWEEYFQYAIKLKNDAKFLLAETDLFLHHFSTNLQIKEQVSKIYQRLCHIAEQKYQ